MRDARKFAFQVSGFMDILDQNSSKYCPLSASERCPPCRELIYRGICFVLPEPASSVRPREVSALRELSVLANLTAFWSLSGPDMWVCVTTNMCLQATNVR